ncbi:MAG TPA: hypothetical protein VN790_09910 [Steroidobacteraceae bacterium]|nr:hypothetical protein [Steroidobacteraceae bacterium]
MDSVSATVNGNGPCARSGCSVVDGRKAYAFEEPELAVAVRNLASTAANPGYDGPSAADTDSTPTNPVHTPWTTGAEF